MPDSLPDYTTIDPPDDTPPEAYSTHERRAAILRAVIQAGTPAAVNQRALAARFDVHESTVSRDMDRLREAITEHLGADAHLTTRVVFERTVRELQAAGEWKRAWDVVMDWNDWLADLGAQHREPAKSALDVEMHSQNVDVAYEVIREPDGDPLPRTREGTLDHEAVGFTNGPEPVDVEAVEDADD
jgi:transposase